MNEDFEVEQNGASSTPTPRANVSFDWLSWHLNERIQLSLANILINF